MSQQSRTLPFWKTTTLEAMTEGEWESLCDGCGRCCLVKLEDEDSGKIHFTDVRCRLLDGASCRCSDYPNRQEKVSDCLRLTPKDARELSWLPPSCAYRIVAKGGDLPAWHPLVSGRQDSVHEAGISVRGRTSASEDDVQTVDLVDHLVSWPMRMPKRAKTFAG